MRQANDEMVRVFHFTGNRFQDESAPYLGWIWHRTSRLHKTRYPEIYEKLMMFLTLMDFEPMEQGRTRMYMMESCVWDTLLREAGYGGGINDEGDHGQN